MCNLHNKRIKSYYLWLFTYKAIIWVAWRDAVSSSLLHKKETCLDFCAQEICVSENSHLSDSLLMWRKKVTEVLLLLQEVMEPCCLGHQLWSCLLGEWSATRLCWIFIWTRSSVHCLIRGSNTNIPLRTKLWLKCPTAIISQTWRGLWLTAGVELSEHSCLWL